MPRPGRNPARVHWQWEGLDDLKEALRKLPRELVTAGQEIVSDEAHQAVFRIELNYGAHVHTGYLKGSVWVREGQILAGAGAYARIVASAPHAHLFEFGTAARQWQSGKKTGTMPPAPPAHQFVPEVIQARTQMFRRLAELLARNGLEVSGHAG
jgi:hypothetical protein